MSEVAAALDAVNGFRDSPTGTLRLNVPTAVARLVLPPIIGPFLAAHPGIALEVATDDSFVDVLAAGFDAGIRYDERLEKDMIAVPIGPRVQRFMVAAAPAYLDAHGRPSHPKDILNHACIRHRFASGVMHAWEFERDGEIVKITPNARVIANNIDLEISAAIQGLGLIATFEGFVEQELKSGALDAGAGGLAAALLRAFSLLPEPPAHARTPARLRGFHQAANAAQHCIGGASRLSIGYRSTPNRRRAACVKRCIYACSAPGMPCSSLLQGRPSNGSDGFFSVSISSWSALNGLSRSRLRKDPARLTRSRPFALP